MNDESHDYKDVKSHVTNTTLWLRLPYILLFAIVLHLASLVMWALCGLQFLFSILTGKDNENLRHLGLSIAQYIHQTLLYVSYNSDDKPFPFSAWPDVNPAKDEDDTVMSNPKLDSGESPQNT